MYGTSSNKYNFKKKEKLEREKKKVQFFCMQLQTSLNVNFSVDSYLELVLGSGCKSIELGVGARPVEG